MLDILISILISIGTGVLFAIPAIVLGFWLKKAGIAPYRSWLSLLFCVVLAFIRQFWLLNLAYGWLALLSVIGSTLGVYRMDIYWSIKQTNTHE
jgi:hypothetical protein